MKERKREFISLIYWFPCPNACTVVAAPDLAQQLGTPSRAPSAWTCLGVRQQAAGCEVKDLVLEPAWWYGMWHSKQWLNCCTKCLGLEFNIHHVAQLLAAAAAAATASAMALLGELRLVPVASFWCSASSVCFVVFWDDDPCLFQIFSWLFCEQLQGRFILILKSAEWCSCCSAHFGCCPAGQGTHCLCLVSSSVSSTSWSSLSSGLPHLVPRADLLLLPLFLLHTQPAFSIQAPDGDWFYMALWGRVQGPAVPSTSMVMCFLLVFLCPTPAPWQECFVDKSYKIGLDFTCSSQSELTSNILFNSYNYTVKTTRVCIVVFISRMKKNWNPKRLRGRRFQDW